MVVPVATQIEQARAHPFVAAGQGQRNEWLTPSVLAGSVRVLDCLIVAVCGVVAYGLRHGDIDMPSMAIASVIFATLLSANFFQLAGVYEMDRLGDLFRQISRVPFAWIMLFLALMLIGYMTKTVEEFSRIWVALWFLLGVGTTLVFRVALRSQMARWRRAGHLTRNVVVVGAGEHGRRFVDHLRQHRHVVQMIGVFDDRSDRVPDYIGDFPVLGNIDDLLRFARKNRIDQIIVALPWTAENRVLQCMRRLKSLPIDVRLCPDLIGFHLPHRGVTHIGGVPLINVFEKPISGWDYVIKATEDRLLASLILLFIAPLMAAIALTVKLTSPGPVIFKQTRYGFNNEEIEVFKFRSMYVHTSQNGGKVDQARKNDPRVTPIGAFLRRTSLDELPQFFNVLRGDMSIVGPRPHAVAHNEQYARLIDEYLARHRVRPGITGWAQINGYRGETDTLEKMEKRVQYDLFYIENWSIMLDLKIIFMTLFVGFSSRNAY